MNQKTKSVMVLCFSRFYSTKTVIGYGKYFVTFLLINLITLTGFSQASDDEQNQRTSAKQKALGESIVSVGLEVMQGITISGTVNDATGGPLPGVNVLEKGTSNGTITDIEGKYSINVKDRGSVIIFSYVGYITEEVPIGDQSEILITLVEDLIGLNEVVVVGYGAVKKSDVTGSLASVSSEQLSEMPLTNINQALQGRAAGVDIATTTFGLNSKPQVRIRGNRSIKAKNDPLYVVDGIPIAGDVTDLNPGDIESVEILKDASATAIYGSRGANGVILITTKRGSAGELRVNLESSWSLTNPLRFYDQLTGDQWLEIARNNLRASSYDTPWPDPYSDYAIVSSWPATAWESVAMGYEWVDQTSSNPNSWEVATRPVTDEERARWSQVIDNVPDEIPVYNPNSVRTHDWYSDGMNKNALTQNYQFSVSGGTEKLSVYFSVGYIDQEGQGIGERFQRINPRLNLDFQALKWLKVGCSATFGSEITDPGEGLLTGVTSMLPITTPYDSSGNYLLLPTGDTQVKNPIRDEEVDAHENRVNRYIGTYYGEISFTDHLRYRMNIGQDFRYFREGEYRDAMSSDIYPGVNSAKYRQGHSAHFTLDNLLFYNRDFGPHSFGLTLLQSIETRKMERLEVSAEDLPYATQLWYSLNSAPDITQTTINGYIGGNVDSEYDLPYSKWQMASFMGRINYGLLDKYLLTASIRFDGSSVFYSENRWDYFPSAAFAWKVHNESFMENLAFITQFKLRLGYGTVGQAGNVPYETAGSLESTQYVFGEEPAKGWGPDLIQTQEVGWEKTTTVNLGLDFGMFRNRVFGTVELYRANTRDLLLDLEIPAVSGHSQLRQNVGKTKNQGIEITLSTVNIDRGGFRWESDFTFTANQEEIVELAEGAQDDIANELFIGYPVRSYYTYDYEGIWQISDSALIDFYNSTGNNGFAPGKIRVRDIDGNDTINSDDQRVVGTSVPKFSGGFNNRFYYKGFELSFFLFFRVGTSIYSRDGHYFPMTSRYATPFNVNYYRPLATAEENADAEHPAPSNIRDRYENALYCKKASFLKVRHITLSYNVPSSVLSKAKISSLTLSVQAVNPFLFTDYSFLDPEAQRPADTEIRTPQGVSGRGWTFSIKIGL